MWQFDSQAFSTNEKKIRLNQILCVYLWMNRGFTANKKIQIIEIYKADLLTIINEEWNVNNWIKILRDWSVMNYAKIFDKIFVQFRPQRIFNDWLFAS